MEHQIKILNKFAKEHLNGTKPWELRKNDRNYKEGDVILFKVVDKYNKSTGISYKRKITYLLKGGIYGLQDGFCIFTLGYINIYTSSNQIDLFDLIEEIEKQPHG